MLIVLDCNPILQSLLLYTCCCLLFSFFMINSYVIINPFTTNHFNYVLIIPYHIDYVLVGHFDSTIPCTLSTHNSITYVLIDHTGNTIPCNCVLIATLVTPYHANYILLDHTGNIISCKLWKEYLYVLLFNLFNFKMTINKDVYCQFYIYLHMLSYCKITKIAVWQLFLK